MQKENAERPGAFRILRLWVVRILLGVFALVVLQADLASRCADSIHITVANSTHIIPLDQPAAVVDAIRQVVEAARERKPLRPEKQQ